MVVAATGTGASPTVRRGAATSVATLLLALSAPGDIVGMQAGSPTWTTRPAQTIRIPGTEADSLEPRARLRIGGGGTRIVVVTGDLLRRREWRLSIWTPDGSLLVAAESHEMAEGVNMPSRLRASADGFRLHHGDRDVWYGYEDARPLRTEFPTAGLGRLWRLDNGELLGLGRVPGWFAAEGVKPETQAIIHAQPVGDGWRQDTIGFRDIRNRGWYLELPPDTSRPNVVHEISGPPQPFADHDLVSVDWEAGSVVVVRRNPAPGTAEVTELLASGDTAWQRRLVLEVMPLAPERAEEIIEARLARSEGYGAPWAGRPDARAVVKDAVYVPSHLPAATGMVLTASREVWLRTPREEGGMVVWHSIPRGAGEMESRRVLLPATFLLRDVFGDHAWGFSASDDGTRVAIALRLVPPKG